MNDSDKAKEGAEALGEFLSQFGQPTPESKLVLGILFEVLNKYRPNATKPTAEPNNQREVEQ